MRSIFGKGLTPLAIRMFSSFLKTLIPEAVG
jgi:hypothetical protein